MYEDGNELGEMSNTKLHGLIGETPFKASVIEIWRNRFKLWMQDGRTVILKKSPRYSHYGLGRGDLETFQLRKVEKNGNIRMVLDVIGRDNLLIPIEERARRKDFIGKQLPKTKKTKLRNIPEGEYIIHVFIKDNDRMVFSIDGEEHTIQTPRNDEFEEPQIGTNIKVKIVHKKAISSNGKEFILGMMHTMHDEDSRD